MWKSPVIEVIDLSDFEDFAKMRLIIENLYAQQLGKLDNRFLSKATKLARANIPFYRATYAKEWALIPTLKSNSVFLPTRLQALSGSDPLFALAASPARPPGGNSALNRAQHVFLPLIRERSSIGAAIRRVIRTLVHCHAQVQRRLLILAHAVQHVAEQVVPLSRALGNAHQCLAGGG